MQLLHAFTLLLVLYLTAVYNSRLSPSNWGPTFIQTRTMRNRASGTILPSFGQMVINRSVLATLSIVEYDYPDIRYPIPFNELYSIKENRYVNFGGSFADLPDGVLTGEVPSFSLQTSDLLMMTGASENHVFSSFNCLYSMVLADPYASFLYLDLGIQESSLVKLYSHFETVLQIQQKMKSTGHLAYRRINWLHFPDWMVLHKNRRQRGGYSWKVVAEMDVFYEWKALFYWLDAGDLIREGVSRECTMARHYGFYSPFSHADIQRWVFNETQMWLIENGIFHHVVPSTTKMIMSGVYTLDYSNSTMRSFLASVFLKCAYTAKCIAPYGSSLRNHRFDQAVLTLLMGYLQVPYSGDTHYHYAPAVHVDMGNDESMTNLVLNNLYLKIQHTYSITLTNKLYQTRGLNYTFIPFREVSRPQDRNWPAAV